MSALILFIGFIAGGTLLLWLSARKSPAGYQDETGFHFGIYDGYAARNALEQIQNMPNAEVIASREKTPQQFADETFAPFFPLRFPWLIKGFGLAALLVSLVVFPKTSQNVGPLFSETEATEPTAENLTPSAFDFETTDAVLVASAPMEDSRFGQKLCVRFSQVE